MKNPNLISKIEIHAFRAAIDDINFRMVVNPKLFTTRGIDICLDDLKNTDYIKESNDFASVWSVLSQKYSKRSWFAPLEEEVSKSVASKSAYKDLMELHSQKVAQRDINNLSICLSEGFEVFQTQLSNTFYKHIASNRFEVQSLASAYVQGLSTPPKIFKTPFRGLNKIMGGGLSTGRLHILGARTGIGKTSMAIETMTYMAKENPDHEFLYVSLEMSHLELVNRFASVMGISASDSTLKKIEAFKSLPNLLVVQSSSASLLEVEAELAKRKIRMVAIDYLGLMELDTADVPYYKRIGNMSKGLQSIAKKYNVGILALSQLRRAALLTSKTKELEPDLSDLRDSGELEQDADTVALIHRVNINDTAACLLIRKNRHGPCGRVVLEFKNGRFVNSNIS